MILAGLSAAEQALNHLVTEQRVELAGLLDSLEGRPLLLRCSAPAFALHLAVVGGAIRLSTAAQAPGAVEISGSGRQLFETLRAHHSGGLAAGQVNINGEIGAAQGWQRLFASLDIDPEEWLAGRIGDVAAHQVGRTLRGAAAWLRQSLGALEQSTSEYLVHETALVTAQDELATHFGEIKRLAMDVDRAAARLDRLKQRIGSRQ